MAQSQEPIIICIEKVALDMCGRCARPLEGNTDTMLNHWHAGDPERATCCAVSGDKFEPAPRFCMLAEEDHKDKIPELVEVLRRAEWHQVPYGTNPFRIGREGLLILARAASSVLAVEPHAFKPGILCPSCRGERLLDEIVGAVPGLRPGTRMPVVSGRKTRCSKCGGIGVMPSTL